MVDIKTIKVDVKTAKVTYVIVSEAEIRFDSSSSDSRPKLFPPILHYVASYRVPLVCL